MMATVAHLTEANHRIGKALDADYIYNGGAGGGMSGFPFMFLQPTPGAQK